MSSNAEFKKWALSTTIVTIRPWSIIKQDIQELNHILSIHFLLQSIHQRPFQSSNRSTICTQRGLYKSNIQWSLIPRKRMTRHRSSSLPTVCGILPFTQLCFVFFYQAILLLQFQTSSSIATKVRCILHILMVVSRTFVPMSALQNWMEVQTRNSKRTIRRSRSRSRRKRFPHWELSSRKCKRNLCTWEPSLHPTRSTQNSEHKSDGANRNARSRLLQQQLSQSQNG